MTPHLLSTSLIELASCVCTTLAMESEPVCWCGLYPGNLPAWEHCGECAGSACGMAYVAMVSAYPFGGLGVADPEPTCSTGLGAVVNIGVLRCLPVGGADGEPPTASEMSETSLLLFNDMIATRNAALCCFQEDVLLREYTALPAAGGCVGGQWTLHLELR